VLLPWQPDHCPAVLASWVDSRLGGVQVTLVNVLEASRIADGPIAQAALPYKLPLGFHGNFYAART